MMEQMDIFAASGGKARLTKPLRLIELFAGYGSQRLSIKYLGVPCESWCVSEWATNSIRAYKDLHCGDANDDYAAAMTDDEIRAWMLGRISKDYNVPLTEKQIAKIKPAELRQIYNDMRNSRNFGSICLMRGSDLNIVDTDKYDYILTYSFPCQDLSTAGTMNGMHEGSGTRSSLLWEVKRLLSECTELPAMLLCENVPQVLAKKNIGEFQRFISFLDSLGYKSYYKIINATSFGVPQTRKRFFMVSLLADEPYSFPEERPLKDKLKHYLEHNVSEKYYIPQETVEKFMSQIGNVEREREREREE